MEKSNYEELREKYKPSKVKVLFVGESRPESGTFFYAENSNLYKYTKEAFERFHHESDGNWLEFFKKCGGWLYDVCDVPVNSLSGSERCRQIELGLPNLLDTIKELKPKYIIVVKKGEMKKITFERICKEGYVNEETTFNLPFPACGRQNEYRDGLSEIIKKLDM
ncbi:MAG: hypothetical protein LBT26_09580 [Clostridiales Family XIII bacterium]|jgi:hypothetical protein|nr:hypothetical protein [Clostridiales Family XIII bacterium]